MLHCFGAAGLFDMGVARSVGFCSVILLPRVRRLGGRRFPVFAGVVVKRVSFFLVSFSSCAGVFIWRYRGWRIVVVNERGRVGWLGRLPCSSRSRFITISKQREIKGPCLVERTFGCDFTFRTEA